jgi:serine O-acetyltransferase
MEQTVTSQPSVGEVQSAVPERFGFWALVREDWVTNGRDWTRPGFRALFMYRLGVWRMGIRWRLLRWPFSVLYRVLHRWVRNHYGIELHYTAKVGRRVTIAHQGAIVIHEGAEIGDECVIRQGVTLGAAGHYSAVEAPRLGRGVNVGAGVVIMGSVTIGDGAKIGPNAVVMGHVPGGAIATAAPARIIAPPKPDDRS